MHCSDRLEEILEYATEDISKTAWAAEQLLCPGGLHEQDYLFLEMAQGISRYNRFLRILPRDAEKKYAAYLQKLDCLHDIAVRTCQTLFTCKKDELQSIVSNQMVERLSGLNALLFRTRCMKEDRDLLEQPDWLMEEEMNLWEHFLIRFGKLTHLRMILGSPFFSKYLDCSGFEKAYQETEDLFRGEMNTFTGDPGFLSFLQEREYGMDFWWFEEVGKTADHRDDQGEEWVAAFLCRIQKEMQSTSAPPECSFMDSVIACATDSLKPELPPALRAHLLECPFCFDLYMDIRHVDAADMQAPEEVPEALARAIRSASPESVRRWEMESFRKTLQRISDWFSGVAFPQKGLASGLSFALVFLVLGTLFIQVYSPGNSGEPSRKTPSSYASIGHSPATLGILAGIRGNEITRSASYQTVSLENNGKLRSGERFRVQFAPEKDGYAYVLLWDSSGKIVKLFSGQVVGKQKYIIPGRDWFYLDDKTGTESIYVLTGACMVEDFEPRIRRLKQKNKHAIAKLFPEHAVQSYHIRHLP